MTQRHRIVNLTKREVLDAQKLGERNILSPMIVNGTVQMAALLWLLSEEWANDQVAIIGEVASDSDLPQSAELCGIPASQLCFPATHGHQPFTHVSKKCREALEDYGYGFTRHPPLAPGRSHWWTSGRHGVERVRARLEESDRPFIVVNHTKNQFLDPTSLRASGDVRRETLGAGFGSAVLNLRGTNTPGRANAANALPGSLALLLSASIQHDDGFWLPEFRDHPLVGSWAGDKIEVVFDDAPQECTDISAQMRHHFSGHEVLRSGVLNIRRGCACGCEDRDEQDEV